MTSRSEPSDVRLHFEGSPVGRWLLHRLGWTVRFDGLPGLQGMLVVYPHTSNWDFVVLVLVKWALGIPAHFWAKHSLFRIPLFGAWLRMLGGVPIDRSAPQGVVGQTVQAYLQARERSSYFWLALAPEGTRKRLPGWRSGFYHVVLQAGVPMGLVRLDYGRREVTLTDFIDLSGDVGQDLAAISSIYAGVVGRRPSHAAPIRLMDTVGGRRPELPQ